MISNIIIATLASATILTPLLYVSFKQPVVDPEPRTFVGRINQAEPQPIVLDKQAKKDIDCLAANIYFEARGEPIEGQLAVAHVTLNRMEHPEFPKTACGVVKQKAYNPKVQKHVCQFSWWCDSKLRAKSTGHKFNDRHVYEDIRQLATKLWVNRHVIEDITHGAIFYHAKYVPVHKIGVKGLKKTAQYGQHIFYTKQYNRG
jgi:spore germination cell wall hydrolase CwlJ-like protein